VREHPKRNETQPEAEIGGRPRSKDSGSSGSLTCLPLLQQICRNPVRQAGSLAQAAETTPDGLPSFARQNLGTRSGAYGGYVSRPD
jgi:hypothetical protein